MGRIWAPFKRFAPLLVEPSGCSEGGGVEVERTLVVAAAAGVNASMENEGLRYGMYGGWSGACRARGFPI